MFGTGIIDPEARTLIQSVRSDDAWQDTVPALDDKLISPALSGFRLALRTLVGG